MMPATYYVLGLTDDNRLETIGGFVDKVIAETVASDHGRAASFTDDATVKTVVDWLESQGLAEDEITLAIAYNQQNTFTAVHKEIDARLGKMVGSGRVQAETASAMRAAINDLIAEMTGKPVELTEPDFTGIIGLDGVRMNREQVGPCHACGSIASTHKECMEPGRSHCCPEAYCEACGVATVGGKTAVETAGHFRNGPVAIIPTLSNLIRRVGYGTATAEEMRDGASHLLCPRTPIDRRLAAPEFRPAMAALALALYERANAITGMLNGEDR